MINIINFKTVSYLNPRINRQLHRQTGTFNECLVQGTHRCLDEIHIGFSRENAEFQQLSVIFSYLGTWQMPSPLVP